ncbi:MAG: rhomboid family intramembrane serine protease [Bacteriovoracaceae bacterium]|nr:rhomboid family intramembrane serine protease [Bacteriovoracaceae bacterium]
MNGGIHLPQLSKTNKVIIIAMVAAFLLGSIMKEFADFQFATLLGLSTANILRGNILSPFSYPFIGTGLMEVVFNGMLFWFIGSELEPLWGRKRYLTFMAVSLLGGALIFLFLQFMFMGTSLLSLTGMAGVTSSMLVAYAILYPDRTFLFMLIFPVKAKYFCMLLIGMQLYMGIFSPSFILAWGHLGAILSGFLYMAYVANAKNFKGMPSFKAKKKKNHLKLVDDEDKSNGPKYWH